MSWTIGDRVWVRDDHPPTMLHVRTPAYLRGKQGVVERVLGPFPNPEDLAYGKKAPALFLLRVHFTMAEIWGDEAEKPADTIEAEIYEHWLVKLQGAEDA